MYIIIIYDMHMYVCMCVPCIHDETAWYVDKHAPIYASDVITSTLT